MPGKRKVRELPSLLGGKRKIFHTAQRDGADRSLIGFSSTFGDQAVIWGRRSFPIVEGPKNRENYRD